MILYQQFLAILLHTFQTLRRDRIFVPAFFCGIGMILIALTASDWSFENIKQVFFDIGSFGFHISGVFVAMFWGTQLIAKATQDGSSQMQLVAPIPRFLWILGNYAGLVLTLSIFSILLIILWQATIWLYDGWYLSLQEVTILFFHTVSWWVIAALALCLATLTSHNTALFSTICLWIAGIMVPTFAEAIREHTPMISRLTLQILSYGWNLQTFHIDSIHVLPNTSQLFWKFIYAATLITGLLSIATISFKKRDLGRNSHL